MGIYGNAVGGCGLPNSLVFIDDDGNEYIGFVVGEEVVFTATASDIAKGKIAGTADGVTVGTHTCE